MSDVFRKSAASQLASTLDYLQIVLSHKIFCLSFSLLVVLIVLRQHEKMTSTHTLAKRANQVLKKFSMGCDATGELKLHQKSI